MGYRDEREAERARIEALEHDLAEANERAARAEAQAATARAQASEAQRAAAARATDADGAAHPKKSRAERKRDKLRRAAAAADARGGGSTAVDSWSDAARRRYFRASYVLSLVAYCAVAGVVASSGGGEDELTQAGAIGACGAVVTLLVGHFVIGRVTRAPGAFNGAMITLLSAGLTLGSGILAPVLLDDVADTIAPGHPLPRAVHAVAVVVALALGSFVTAYWSSDVARSGTVGSD